MLAPVPAKMSGGHDASHVSCEAALVAAKATKMPIAISGRLHVLLVRAYDAIVAPAAA